MSKIQIDFRSKTPIYLQVAEQMRREVAAGGLAAESQLPTVRQLAADLRVNFNTVARAYRMLDEAGLISTQQGRGTFVLPIEGPEASHRLRRESLRDLVRSFIGEAARLGWQPAEVADETQHMLQRWQAQGQPPRMSGSAPQEREKETGSSEANKPVS
jgi:GntR family transcriptional regulator